jgi:O-antigen ligase
LAIPRELSAVPRLALAAPRALTFSTAAILFLAAFASSAGWRAAFLIIAGLALATRLRESLRILQDNVPRDVAFFGIAWIAICAASTVWSIDPAYTLAQLKPEILYGSAAFAVFFIAAVSRPAAWAPWWAALMAGAALAFAGRLLQDFLPFEISSHEVDGGVGAYSTHLVLVMPLLFALDWPRPWGRGHHPRALLVGLALVLAAAWYTGNRIVWLAFVAQLVVGMATWRKLPGTARERSATLRRLAAVAAIAFAVAFAAAIAERYERDVLHDTGVPPGLEHDLRPRIWATAWDKLLEAPWLGHGFGREILGAAFEPLTPQRPNFPALRHAHNTFMDMALEVGAVGLAALLGLLLALARRYGAMLRDPRLAPLGMMGLALLAGFVVKNLTDDFLHRQNSLVFWALNATLLGLARSAARADAQAD